MASVADPEVAAAVAATRSALAGLRSLGLHPSSVDDAHALTRAIEGCAREVRALQLQVLDQIERSGLHHADGHRSAVVLVRHAANLSKPEAKRRAKVVRMLQGMPLVAAGFAIGRIGSCQVERIARTYGNRRVQVALIAADEDIAVLAARLPYPEFDAKLTDWERLTDEDGAADRSERNHENRTASFTAEFDGSWRIQAACGGLQGAEMHDIFDHYVEAEVLADWAQARAERGEDATVDDLARTDGQRRMDALYRIFCDAAGHAASMPGGSQICTELVIDQETFERHLRRACGDHPEPDARLATFFTDLIATTSPQDDPFGSGSIDADHDEPVVNAAPDLGRSFRSGTIDGYPIHPSEIVAAALVSHVRRVVMSRTGVVLDMGRRERLFTGARRTAIQLTNTTCVWPGCEVPVSQCESDHIDGWAALTRGPTNPTNGAPLCGKHNRWKEQGFRVVRDDNGRWHIHRPDGTEADAPARPAPNPRGGSPPGIALSDPLTRGMASAEPQERHADRSMTELAHEGSRHPLTTTPVVGTPGVTYADVLAPGTEQLGVNEVRVTILGSGDPFVKKCQASASVLIEVGNEQHDLFFFDLGSGSLANFNGLRLPVTSPPRARTPHADPVVEPGQERPP